MGEHTIYGHGFVLKLVALIKPTIHHSNINSHRHQRMPTKWRIGSMCTDMYQHHWIILLQLSAWIQSIWICLPRFGWLAHYKINVAFIVRFSTTDINECLPNGGLGPCAQNCTNTIGSFYCSCNTGYTLSGYACNGKFVITYYVKRKDVRLGLAVE